MSDNIHLESTISLIERTTDSFRSIKEVNGGRKEYTTRLSRRVLRASAEIVRKLARPLGPNEPVVRRSVHPVST